MGNTDWARERTASWTRRSAEVDARLRDLHERNVQLSAGFGPPDLGERTAAGSTPEQLVRARAAAKTAKLRALEAVQRAAAMRLRAARAHDRAAQLHEMLADATSGDVAEHRDRAAAHRRLAREDRAAADETLGSQPVQLPESG